MGIREIKLVNVTGHEVVILNEEAFTLHGVEPTVKLAIPASEHQAKVAYKTRVIDKVLFQGRVITITSTEYGEVMGLPDPEPNTFYIASKVVAEAVYGKRHDVLILSGFYRDSNKSIIGCRNLAKLRK